MFTTVEIAEVTGGKLLGGSVTVTGNVKKIDDYQRLLILTDRAQIPLDEIVDIESELFNNIG